jgi:LPS-assembly protein
MGCLRRASKGLWLAGVAGGALACALGGASGASAQSRIRPPTGPPPRPAPAVVAPQDTTADQLLGSDAFYLEADTIVRDEQSHLWIARGSVESRYNGRTLRAKEVTYNQLNGVVTARGDVQLLNADGTTEFAQSMTLDKEFRTGVALGFSARQQDNAKVAADEAVRLNQDTMALNKAVFTVCDICAADGSPKSPTWSIQAAQVIQDHKRQIVYYKNVIIRVKGLPVAYSPVFWHVDPQAKRGSGLLAPRIAYDSRRGFSYEQPYLFVLSPYADLTVAPQINSKVNPLLEAEYRERFYSGQVDVRLGYTYDEQFDSNGHRYDTASSRSYVLAQGAFAPTDTWAWGFSAERVTDPLMFQRYDIPNVFDPRGLYPTDDQRLISQLYAVEQDSKSYISIAAMSIQGLRPSDRNGTFPLIAPMIDARYEPDFQILGGRLRLEGSGVLLQRTRAVASDTAPGEDSRRASFGGDWLSSYTLANGIRLQPFANARGDVYNVADVSPTDTGLHTTGRLLGTLGVDASWPFFRRTVDMTVILEPLAQLAISPKATTDRFIPNEDSQVIDFDETNLFDANKSPGFDYYEGGARANVGGRATFRWDDGSTAQLLLGRSLRAQTDNTLPANTSLNQTASDWVVAASVQPSGPFSAYSRALLDGQTFEIHRIEVGFNGAISRANGFLRYLYDEVDSNGLRTENIQAGGQVLVTKHWGLVGSSNWDLAARVPVREEIGVLYQDECTHWELVYQHDGTYDRTLHPSDKIVLRLLLVTLGGTGYQSP